MSRVLGVMRARRGPGVDAAGGGWRCVFRTVRMPGRGDPNRRHVDRGHMSGRRHLAQEHEKRDQAPMRQSGHGPSVSLRRRCGTCGLLRPCIEHDDGTVAEMGDEEQVTARGSDTDQYANDGNAPAAKRTCRGRMANCWRLADAGTRLASVTAVNGAVIQGEGRQNTVALRAEQLVHAAAGHVAHVGDVQVEGRKFHR